MRCSVGSDGVIAPVSIRATAAALTFAYLASSRWLKSALRRTRRTIEDKG
jgi:hypothetical protein